MDRNRKVALQIAVAFDGRVAKIGVDKGCVAKLDQTSEDPRRDEDVVRVRDPIVRSAMAEDGVPAGAKLDAMQAVGACTRNVRVGCRRDACVEAQRVMFLQIGGTIREPEDRCRGKETAVPCHVV